MFVIDCVSLFYTQLIFVESQASPIQFLGYERVYLPLCIVADAPFHIQGDELLDQWWADGGPSIQKLVSFPVSPELRDR